jgi:hypothetical protein
MINIPVDDEEPIDPHDNKRLRLHDAARLLMIHAMSDRFDYERDHLLIDQVISTALVLNDVK